MTSESIFTYGAPDLKFGPGKWIEVDGKPAEVPGVW